MKLSRPDSDVFLPEVSAGLTPAAALARTTHLCVIAHQDDIEINAYPAVAECYGRTDKFFTGVVMTNGAGSARTGKYGHVTDAQRVYPLTNDDGERVTQPFDFSGESPVVVVASAGSERQQ